MKNKQETGMNNDLLPWWINRAVANAPSMLSVESIASLSDKDVEEYIADRLWNAWSAYGYNASVFLNTLPSGARAFFITWLVEAEVENGGFLQLYLNGYGALAKMAPAAFEYFGAKRHADVVREAIAERGKERVLIFILRISSWSATLPIFYNLFNFFKLYKLHDLSKLEAVDDRYYRLPKTLSAGRIEKIRSQPNLFLLKQK